MKTPTDAELLPCPFCGSKEVNIADDLITFYGECGSCGATAAYSSYRTVAVQAWNRRAPQAGASGEPVATQPTPDVAAKMQSNTWDHFGDILPTLKAISRGDWYWGANSRCKYIEIRLDTRDGGCLLYDRERVRISPAQFAHQSYSVKMDAWPAHNSPDTAPPPQAVREPTPAEDAMLRAALHCVRPSW